MKKYDELKFYIITEIYLFMTKSELNQIKTIIDKRNNNTKIISFNNDTNREPLLNGISNRKNESEIKKEEKIIEDEDNYEYKAFEELKLYNNFEIHFYIF